MTAARNREPIYVFNHLQRSAGGAMAAALARRFRVVPDYQAGATERDLAHWLAHPLALNGLRPGDVLMGHYTAPGGRLHERYPEVFNSAGYRLITFFREPLDWVESHLRYFGCAELGVQDADAALELLAGTYVRACALPAGTRHVHPLQAYWFVGACSEDAEDARRLLRRLGIDDQVLQRVNPSPRRGGLAPLSAAQRARYRVLAAGDFALYDWARRCQSGTTPA